MLSLCIAFPWRANHPERFPGRERLCDEAVLCHAGVLSDNPSSIIEGVAMAQVRQSRQKRAGARQAPVKPGQRIELVLEALVNGGEALGRYEGLPVFVPQGVPGDRIEASIVSTKPGYARATIQRILEPSQQRIVAPCPVFGQCGGCQWQMLDYGQQVEWKTRLVAEALLRHGGWADTSRLRDTLGSSDPWHYRNKVHWAVAKPEGSWQVGLYEPRTHALVDTDTCAIQAPINNTILERVKGILADLPIAPYNERTGSGWLRSIFAKTSQITHDTMLGLVVRHDDPKLVARLGERVRLELPTVTTLIINIHPAPGNKLLGDDTRVVFGSGVIRERIGPIELAISAQSFFQVNSTMTALLYQTVAHAAQCDQAPTVLDAYCGTGSIALYLAASGARHVTGLEIVPAAIDDARRNAVDNQLADRAHFEVGDVTTLLTQHQHLRETPDVLVLDPPRKGCETHALEALAALASPRIIYVSCNPVTLARDLRVLDALGYATESVQPVDMFPQTAHIECVATLTRNQAGLGRRDTEQ